MAKKLPPGVTKLDFSDKAKAAAGIDPSDFGKELERQRQGFAAANGILKQRITVLEEGVTAAITAFDEGRRGDAMKALRALLPKPPAGQRDDGPGRLA